MLEPHEEVQIKKFLENNSPIRASEKLQIHRRWKPITDTDSEDTKVLIRLVTNKDQVLVSESIQVRILDLAHSSLKSGHPGKRNMYETKRCFYYCPHIDLNCVHYVRNCESCARKRIQLRRYVKPLRPLPASSLLWEFAIVLLGLLHKCSRNYTHLFIITGRFTKLTKTVPLLEN